MDNEYKPKANIINELIPDFDLPCKEAEEKFKSWSDERCKEQWNSLGGSHHECVSAMEGKTTDAAAYCAALKDRIKGTTKWRGKESSIIKKAVIRKNDKGEYCVKSPDNPDWNGGCYDTKEEAEERLQEVEYFKSEGNLKKAQYDNGKYMEIVFIQNPSEWEECEEVLETQGKKGLLEYLSQWDMGTGFEEYDELPFGTSDTIVFGEEYGMPGYIMGYNTGMGYCGLVREIEGEEY